jgi:hypothetical protein
MALLVDEIMLTSIFHVLLGEGNTVAAIAIALVGLSASGIAAYLLPAFHDEQQLPRLQSKLLFAFGISLVVAVFVIMNIPVTHGDFNFSRDQASVRLARLAVYNTSVIPFFVGGLAINAILRTGFRSIGRLYFADLIGAATGCLLSPFLLSVLGAPRAIVCVALVPVLISRLAAATTWRPSLALMAVPLVFVAADLVRPQMLSFVKMNTMGRVEAPRYRSFDIEAGDLVFEQWALDAWTVLRSDNIPQQWEDFRGWGLSDTYDGPIPEFVQINFNARFSTYVTEFDGDFSKIAEWLDADLTSLHYLLGREFPNVLNIAGGGGREVLNALHHNAKHVVAVDVNEVAIEVLMKDRLRSFSGDLYFDSRVTAIADEGRSFAERSSETFDLLDFSIAGGMNLEKMELLRVDDLFTREALGTYFRRLDDDGVFSYVMYSTRADVLEKVVDRDFLTDQPYIPAIKVLAGIRLIARENGWGGDEFGRHVLVAALRGRVSPNYDLVHIIASKTPFTDEERQRFLALCNRLDFIAFHPTDPNRAEPNLYHRLAAAGGLSELSDALPFSILPATDNRPFHYAFDLAHLGEALKRGKLTEMLAGNPLISMAINIGLLAIGVTFGPLLWSRLRRGGDGPSQKMSYSLLGFFACIGFGYMAIEIAVLLKLGVFLGKPIYGLSVGLFAFLFSSGLGSAFSSRFEPSKLHRSLYGLVALLIVLGTLFVGLSTELFSANVAQPIAIRIAIAVASVFPVAFLMGMFFPSGIVLVSGGRESLIPLAWAINGCFSILGIFGTRIIALFAGFDSAMVIGWCAYLLAALCIAIHARSRDRFEAA